MTPTTIFVLLLYAAFMATGWIASRRARAGTAVDLMLAGRQLPLWLAALTMTATWVDGGYLLGTTEGTYTSSIQLGAQGGLCFGLSLVLGGLFFARTMRSHGFVTLIDPFEARFGRPWAAVLVLPALAGELFWSAELLVALGSTFGVLLGMTLTAAILVAAVVTTAYTTLGGMWSVAYTDALQLVLIAIGLAVAVPYVLDAAGGLEVAWLRYAAARPDGVGIVPARSTMGGIWSTQAVVSWWDVSLMLMLGGIPWNCYFQRVLSCASPAKAAGHSVAAGVLTIAFTVPPLLLGIGAFSYPWPADAARRLQSSPAETMPLLFAQAVPPFVSMLGLAAIAAAVTSSFSSSILSAGSMLTWNGVKRLVWPSLTAAQTSRVLRTSIVLLGGLAVAIALQVRGVQALWFLTADLVFVLLFPQLVCALFDREANRVGSIAAFVVSLVLRAGGGEPLFGIPPLVPYPEIFAPVLLGAPADWYSSSGAMLFPFKALAAGAGLLLLPAVSRLSARWDRPRPLRNPSAGDREAIRSPCRA
ncbi:MAG: sodium:solute symporter family protein [Vicinamibacterales bacterium]